MTQKIVQLEHSHSMSTETALLINPELKKPINFVPKLKLGVMASGNGSNFEALVNACNSGFLDAEILLLIVNNPSCNAINRAKRLGIPFKVLNNKDFERREDHETVIINTLKKYAVEGIVMAGWMRIITTKLIYAFPNKIVNVHPSLLPSFRGYNAVDQALKAGVLLTGCSIHLVVPEVDSGELLVQAAVPIFSSDTKETLLNRIQIQEHKALPIGISIAAQNWRKE